jgi:hypothetical protein
MDKVAIIQAIERVRRLMPRNIDVMLVCDAASVTLLPPVTLQPAPVTLHECAECRRRRAGQAARTRKSRKRQ